MSGTRELNLQEKSALAFALASARAAAYANAVALHDKSTEMENAGESGYLAFDNEAEQYEIFADVYDSLIEFVCENRIVISGREK